MVHERNRPRCRSCADRGLDEYRGRRHPIDRADVPRGGGRSSGHRPSRGRLRGCRDAQPEEGGAPPVIWDCVFLVDRRAVHHREPIGCRALGRGQRLVRARRVLVRLRRYRLPGSAPTLAAMAALAYDGDGAFVHCHAHRILRRQRQKSPGLARASLMGLVVRAERDWPSNPPVQPRASPACQANFRPSEVWLKRFSPLPAHKASDRS